MRVRLLGPVDVEVDGEAREVPGLRRKSVLAVLALRRGEVVPADRLADVVWGAQAGEIAANTLQSHVSYLRRLLGDREVITARAPGYVLNLPPGGVDVEVAEQLIAEGVAAGDPLRRAELMQAALRLWRGRPLADVTGIVWLDEQAVRLDQLWLQATHALFDSRLRLGEHAQLVPQLERLTREHRLDEHLHEQYMTALYRANRQADALAVYRTLRRTLDSELGIEPSRTLRDLEAAILRQDPALHHRPAPPAEAVRPKPPVGTPVRLGGAALIGRDHELAVLQAAVEAAASGTGDAVFLAGEPGIGKTRLAAEASAAAARLGLTVLRGRAAGSGVRFRALSEALLTQARRAGPPDEPELAPYLPALARLVPEWHPRQPEHRPQAPGSAVLLDDSPVVLAEAVLRLLRLLGRSRGCLLVLEDLHDADADTLAVLEYLVDNAAGEPLLVLGTSRSDPGPALELLRAARHRRTATVVELRRLDDTAVRRLAAACLDAAEETVPDPAVARLLATADGVPLHVEELLAGMVADGVLVAGDDGWAFLDTVPARLPVSLAATLADRADRLSPATGALLRAAALLGWRFAARTAGAIAGLDGDTLVACLREAVTAQLLQPQEDPQRYAFRHVLTAEALRARLLPVERAALARRAAEAVEAEGGADTDTELLGELWVTAGDARRAVAHLGRAGGDAVRLGAVSTGVALLERALTLAGAESLLHGTAPARSQHDGTAPARGRHEGADDEVAALVETLVEAYAVAGRVGDAHRLGARFGAVTDAPERRAAMHLRLAQVAVTAGDWAQGSRELAAVEALPGAVGEAQQARMDAIEAALTFGDPGVPDRVVIARQLAAKALAGAEATGQPEVACSALKTLGRCARLTDLAAADAYYERGLVVAEQHDLLSWRITLLYHLGADHGIRHADPARLTEALDVASRAGAVITAFDVELELAVVRLCRGEFAEAAEITERGELIGGRLRLTHARLVALGGRIMVAAHSGRLDVALELRNRFAALGGDELDFTSAVDGFGLAFGHLLHEDLPAAVEALSRAARRESEQAASYLSYIHGPHLFLMVLTGRAGFAEHAALARSAQAQARWNGQFLALAEVLLQHRAGDRQAAERAVAAFEALAEPYPMARHLGLRLVAPAALEGGWGQPVAWLRDAASYFQHHAPAVVRACRVLLRQAGAAVPQHRRGSEALPEWTRRLGITVREYEVLGLVGERLGNQEIGRRLYLSPRTVEKHVAALLGKTGAADRAALAKLAEGTDAAAVQPGDEFG